MTESRKRILSWTIAVLVAAFAGLALYHYKNRARSERDPVLLQELQGATLPGSDKGTVRPGDWPAWRGPLRDGISRETGLLTTWPETGPKVLWQAPAAAGYSSMAIADGKLYTMFRRGDEEEIVCLDAKTGEQRWVYGYQVRYNNEYGGGPRSTPAVDGNRVYAVGVAGMLTCIDTDTGKKVWDHNLLAKYGASNLTWGVSFSPLVHGNLVFTMPGGPNGKSLVAFDKCDGHQVWQAEDDRAGYSSPIIATIAGVPQLVCFTGVALVGVNPETGQHYWRYPWPTDHDCNVGTPIVRGDYVFIASNYGKGCALLKIVSEGGKREAHRVYAHNQFCDHHSGSVLWGEHIYGFHDSALTCLDFRDDGKVLWKKSGLGKGSLVAADGHLFILGENGKLAVVEASPEKYREKASFRFSSQRCWTMPVIADGRFYVRDEEKLVCYDLKNP